eukprot:jgi/Chlat1/5072/Chrsp33S05001
MFLPSSCAQKGYFRDDFVRFFVKRPLKRAPLINRGKPMSWVRSSVMLHWLCPTCYYARWAAIRQIVRQFLSAGGDEAKKQVLSLGAGFDTAFFQLASEGQSFHRYCEVDFPEVTRRKLSIISSNPALKQLFPKLGSDDEQQPEEGFYCSQAYCLLPCDLRSINDLEKVLHKARLDYSLPTLILSECVLVYMKPQHSVDLVRWGGSKFNTAAYVVYEPILPDDPFGEQMLINLEARGSPLLGIHGTPNLQAQRDRFLHTGWQRASAADMDEIYTHHLDQDDRRRVERLELFDEFEEWHIIQQHYCMAIGVKDNTGLLQHVGFARSLQPD